MNTTQLNFIELLQDTSARTRVIMRAAEKVNEGIKELCAAVANMNLTEVKIFGAFDELTTRQKEIFTLVGQEVPTAEIAKRLKIAPRTVDAHSERMRRALKLKSVGELRDLAKQMIRGKTNGASN